MLVGIDACEKKRFKKLALNQHFLEKYFSDYEINYANKTINKELRLAGIFCAKEAFLKALGIGIGGEISLKDIEVKHDNLGKPFLSFNEKTQEYLKKVNISDVQISITHTSVTSYAVAICK